MSFVANNQIKINLLYFIKAADTTMTGDTRCFKNSIGRFCWNLKKNWFWFFINAGKEKYLISSKNSYPLST
jgi:hypothetical protein